MANIDVDVAGRRYDVACRDGEEEHLRALAAVVDRRAQDAQAALGGLTETRQLLFFDYRPRLTSHGGPI